MAEDQRRGRRGGVDTSVRTSAVWDSVHGVLTRRSGELGRPLRVVDLGGGTGGLAVPIAALGHHVTVVDPSPDALAALTRRAGDAGVADRVVAVQGDAATLLEVHPDADADLVCCHGTLEVVDDPAATMRARRGGARRRRLRQPARRPAPRRGARPRPVRALRPGPSRPHQRGRPLGPGRPAATPVRCGRRRRTGARGRAHRAGLPRRADLQRPGARGAHRLRGRPLLLLELEQAASRHPDYTFLGQLGAALHVLASRS